MYRSCQGTTICVHGIGHNSFNKYVIPWLRFFLNIYFPFQNLLTIYYNILRNLLLWDTCFVGISVVLTCAMWCPTYIYHIVTYLSIKEVVCLFVMLKICQTMLLVSLESLWWAGVHQGGFAMFKLPMHELLNIEQFCNWKSNRIKITKFREIGVRSW
jgi:hypothetical protein